MELMEELDFELQYIKRKESIVASALSRQMLANAITHIRNSLIDEIKIHYIEDEAF